MSPDMNLEALRSVIVARFPELADGTFALLMEGWDSVAVDVDDALIFKFPRNEVARTSLIREASVLAAVRPALTMPVPDLAVFEEPRLFSRHHKLKGEHLVTGQYDALPIAARDHLAAALALFYSQLHRIETETMLAAGAQPIGQWLPADAILRRAWPVLPPELRPHAERTITAWQNVLPDPYGTRYGFFDGHGWNMAFDHASNRLNGVYDFADSGFGALQQDFIYSNFIARDLTERIITAYEPLTGRMIDRERVELLSGVLRLTELAEVDTQPDRHAEMIGYVAHWAAGPQ